KFQPPRNMEEIWTETEKAAVGKTLDSPATIIGDPESVKRQLEDFIEQTNADEIMIASAIYDHKERLRSFEILSEMMDLLLIEAVLLLMYSFFFNVVYYFPLKI